MSSHPSSPETATQSSHVMPSRAWYRREPGLALCFAGAVPVVVALVLPGAARVPLFTVAALLMLAGLGLVVRHEMSRSSRVPPPLDD